MSVAIKKLAPPAIVLGIASYLGWPTPAPTNYGDDVVRAKAVRWRPADLADPPKMTSTIDPFRLVLVTTEQKVVEPETGKLVAATKPIGPSVEQLESGLRVSGIAKMGGRNWAIINGKPRLPGDEVRTDDNHQLSCQVISVASDRVVVQCQETIATLQPHRSSAQRPSTITNTTLPEADAQTPVAPTGDAPPPSV